MKKFLSLFFVIAMCISLVACGVQSIGNVTNDTETSTTENSEKTTNNEKKELTAEELETRLNAQELKITSTNYSVQDERYKTLYPDMLQVILQNDTSYDIKNALIAFVAWDENNLPVKIKGSADFSDGSYIKQCNYTDINLVPGGTFGDSYGFGIDESCNIKTFKAIIVSYESFTGEKWDNPLYKDWCKLYEGVKLTPELITE